MQFQVVCPSCKSNLKVGEQHLGKKAPCPKCKNVLDIPKTIPAPGGLSPGGAGAPGAPVMDDGTTKKKKKKKKGQVAPDWVKYVASGAAFVVFFIGGFALSQTFFGGGGEAPMPASPTQANNGNAVVGSDPAARREFSDLAIPFRWIPAGTFTMGSPAIEVNRRDDEDDTSGPGGRPVEVTLSKGFWLGETEVTQAQWQSVMGSNPSYFSSAGDGRDSVVGLSTDGFPVEYVSWYDCLEFCNKLSQLEGVAAHYVLDGIERSKGSIKSATVRLSGNMGGYRLPTEAEWEYACRAGTTMPFHFGSVSDGSQSNVNGDVPYRTTTQGKNLGRTTTVGSYSPNNWGLLDMHGNVFEWCFTTYEDHLRGGRDSVSTNTGKYRVLRGGGWGSDAGFGRSADRGWGTPDGRDRNYGFRLSRTK